MEMSTNERLRSWLAELATEFREEIQELSAEEQRAASRTLGDLSYPCQFLIVWAREPEFQILLLARMNESDDKSVEVHGPFENAKLVDRIEGEVLSSSLIKTVGIEKVESMFAHLLKSLRRLYDPLLGVPKPHVAEQFPISDNPYAVAWMILGNLLELDSRKVASECIKAITDAAKPTVPTAQPEEKVVVEGFGTYIYPPIWVGEMPKPGGLRDRIVGLPLYEYSSERAITEVYRERPIIVTRDGYIAISEKKKPKALEFLNQIMSALLVLGTPVHMIRENDLGAATIKERGFAISYRTFSQRGWLFDQRFSADAVSPSRSRPTVEVEKMKKAIKWAEVFIVNPKVATLLLLHLEARTHFLNSEYKQALVVSWVILEDFHIKDLWSSQIQKRMSDADRLGKLGSWEVDKKLEALDIAGAITSEEYALFMKIKGARNEVVHEGKEPEKEIVERSLEMISTVSQAYVGSHLGTMLSKL